MVLSLCLFLCFAMRLHCPLKKVEFFSQKGLPGIQGCGNIIKLSGAEGSGAGSGTEKFNKVLTMLQFNGII